jgi:hypothetical protein
MSKEITFDDIPLDVWEVWAIQIVGQPVGMATWTRCDEIIKNNPEYFPWEHKYESIPKSVHEAYKAEAFLPWDFYPTDNKDAFTGVIPNLPPPNPEPQPQRTISELFGLLIRQEREAQDRKRAEKKKAKALWDKHYSKYGLEYRE